MEASIAGAVTSYKQRCLKTRVKTPVETRVITFDNGEIFLRAYKRIKADIEVQTFEEWVEQFETLLETSFNTVETEFIKNHSKHLNLLNRIIDLRNEYGDLVDSFYQEAFETFFVEVNGKYLKHAPFFVRRAGRVPINPDVAKLLLLGIEISKKETGDFIKFKQYYTDGSENCFSLKERALFFGDNVALRPPGFYDIVNLFPFKFPVLNNVLAIEEWLHSMKKNLRAGAKKNEESLQVILKGYQRNKKKDAYIQKITSDPYWHKLASRSYFRNKN